MESVREISRHGGIIRGGLPWWLLNNKPQGKCLMILPEDDDVMDFVDDTRALLKLPPAVFSGKPFGIMGFSLDEDAERSRALYQWMFGKVDVLVTSYNGFLASCDSKEGLEKKTKDLRPGSFMTRTALEDLLQAGGYTRGERAEQLGEYAIRGEVVDVWVPGHDCPMRITWNLDTVEGLRPINLYSQRSEGF